LSNFWAHEVVQQVFMNAAKNKSKFGIQQSAHLGF